MIATELIAYLSKFQLCTPQSFSSFFDIKVIELQTQSTWPSPNKVKEILHVSASFAVLSITFATAQTGPGEFTLAAYRLGCPLDGLAVNAVGYGFFLVGSHATYCPLTPQTLCPAGNQTIFSGLGAFFVGTLYPSWVPSF